MGFLETPLAHKLTTLLDFEESGNVATINGGTIAKANGSFTLTNYATLKDPGTAEFTFKKPVSIDSTLLSMDVSRLFRSMSVKVTLMNGATEIASATQSLIISTFTGADGTQYMMIVNKDITKAVNDYSLGLSTTYAVSQFIADANAMNSLGNVSSITLNISAGGAAVYAIK